MTRDLRPGDRVTATGTVTGESPSSPPAVWVQFDQSGDVDLLLREDLTLIEPAEPPVGSVVVKDGEAFLRRAEIEAGWIGLQGRGQRPWSDLSDGDVIFTPGGDS